MTIEPHFRHPGTVPLTAAAGALGRRLAQPLSLACQALVLGDMPTAMASVTDMPPGPQANFQGGSFLAIGPFDTPS